MLLQISELFSDIAQLGIVFALLVAIIFVLGRRVVKLENEKDATMLERLEETKQNVLIIKDATDAMTKVSDKIEKL